MTTQYSLYKSNGSLLTTLNGLETSGPNNLSTPLLTQAKPTHGIVGVGGLTPPTATFRISGDYTGRFVVGLVFVITGSTFNDGSYTVHASGSTYASGPNETTIFVTTAIPNATADGDIIIHGYTLAGDVSSRFIATFTFDVENPGNTGSPASPNIGTYIVSATGSHFDTARNETVIPVTTSVTESSPTIGKYQIVYKINTPYSSEANTTLVLPGKGTLNYGLTLLSNFVRLNENWAADSSPDTNVNIGDDPFGQPMVGQQWYNTTVGSEGYRHYDGTNWVAEVDIDSGSLIFKDLENSNNDIYLTAAETNLPAPWPGGASNEPGLVVWPAINPANNEPVFRVLSQDGSERLRIEHNGTANAGYNRSVNNFEFTATGESYIYGQLGIGDSGLPTIERTLTVEGDGISINAAAATDGVLVIDSPTGQTSRVNFEINNVLIGDVTATTALFTIDGNEISLTTSGTERFRVESDGTLSAKTASYETLVLNDLDMPNKKYVDDAIAATTSSWREPVEVVDSTSTTIPSGTPGNPITVDGESITDTQRVLFIATTVTADRNVWIYDQTAATFSQDTNAETAGDTTTGIRGTYADRTFIYDTTNGWMLDYNFAVGWKGTTTNATQTEILLDGFAGARLDIKPSSVVAFDIILTGINTGNDEAGVYQITGAVKNTLAGSPLVDTTVIVGSIVKTVIAEDNAGWDVTAQADDTNDALVIKVTGIAASTIQWVAQGHVVETTF